MADEDIVYVLISNIPHFYHASDLRNQFSELIETSGFSCFHFRHRPQVQEEFQMSSSNSKSSPRNCPSSKKKMCCVVKVYRNRFEHLIKCYANKHWCDRNGDSIPAKCLINKIKIKARSESQGQVYKTRSEQRDLTHSCREIAFDELQSFKELHPPPLMPNGNVGTATKVFLKLIQACRLPSSIIGKLGLVFPRSRARRMYGSVPFDYGGVCVDSMDDDDFVHTQNGHILSENFVLPTSAGTEDKLEVDDGTSASETDEDDDDDRCEEWERHEALHNDVTQQERCRERLYEEEIELKWEKGGSGLVFYTDAQYWDELEGDFDAKTADDWDIDMSVYYEPGAGDKDATDHMIMRKEKEIRTAQPKSIHYGVMPSSKLPVLQNGFFPEKPGNGRKRNRGTENNETHGSMKIGDFEKHTKGIGRRILEQQGWKNGQGVGKSVVGIPEPIEDFGQCPSDKKGFGFRGEKLVRFPVQKRKRRRKEVHVGCVYINPIQSDPPYPINRSDFHTRLSYRQEFLKAQSS